VSTLIRQDLCFIADTRNLRVRLIDTTGIISTYAGGGTAVPEGSAATSFLLNQVAHVRGDRDGNINVSVMLFHEY
jgi:hypothetical protein